MTKERMREDHFRMYGSDAHMLRDRILSYELRYLRHLRKRQESATNKTGLFGRRICAIRDLRYRRKYGLSILTNHIGRGLYLGHAHDIDVNPAAVIGDNCNINKGVTIGATYRGNRQGAPVIGDRVWIGVGAVLVGKITVGNDVLIAPNAYVACDIPDHSIVTGNPCSIRHREQATEGYISNPVSPGTDG